MLIAFYWRKNVFIRSFKGNKSRVKPFTKKVMSRLHCNLHSFRKSESLSFFFLLCITCVTCFGVFAGASIKQEKKGLVQLYCLVFAISQTPRLMDSNAPPSSPNGRNWPRARSCFRFFFGKCWIRKKRKKFTVSKSHNQDELTRQLQVHV